jgi:hypothetical protein
MQTSTGSTLLEGFAEDYKRLAALKDVDFEYH